MLKKKNQVTIAKGDGIGPEIMEATLSILEKAKAPLAFEEISIGKAVYERGVKTGIPDEAWNSINRTKTLLKAPITTPQGGGYKSLNVTIRKTLGLFANVRPCVSYAPYVDTKFPNMDLVIIRENEEDLYGGIEYRQSIDVMASLKLISRPGTERIVRYAFEYAKAQNRSKVTCMTKDNIMKLSDGLFHKIFDEIGEEYPEIEKNHMIIDIGAAKVAAAPHMFDVIVLPNLYGDIVSDIAAEITGSVGLGGSSNIGRNHAMFEAIHGSAPDIAGQGIANPSGLLLGSIMMLVHLGFGKEARLIHNAWLRTIEDGIHTADLYKEDHSIMKVGTTDFAKAVIDNLGSEPKKLRPVSYASVKAGGIKIPPLKDPEPVEKELVGVDVAVTWEGKDPEVLAELVRRDHVGNMELSIIANRGVKVWPAEKRNMAYADNWRLRFKGKQAVDRNDVLALLKSLSDKGLDFTKAVNLHNFNGEPGYSLAQGE